MELFLTLKLYLHETELFEMLLFWHLTVCRQKLWLATVVEGEPKAPFSIATTPRVGEGATPFSGLLHFTLNPYLIMLSVKQGSIKYHLLSLWYDSTWDWIQVSRAICEHSSHYTNTGQKLY